MTNHIQLPLPQNASRSSAPAHCYGARLEQSVEVTRTRIDCDNRPGIFAQAHVLNHPVPFWSPNKGQRPPAGVPCSQPHPVNRNRRAAMGVNPGCPWIVHGCWPRFTEEKCLRKGWRVRRPPRKGPDPSRRGRRRERGRGEKPINMGSIWR